MAPRMGDCPFLRSKHLGRHFEVEVDLMFPVDWNPTCQQICEHVAEIQGLCATVLTRPAPELQHDSIWSRGSMNSFREYHEVEFMLTGILAHAKVGCPYQYKRKTRRNEAALASQSKGLQELQKDGLSGFRALGALRPGGLGAD